MKLYWLIGPLISTSYAPLMTILVNRDVLCSCGIEVENHFLIKSLAACQDMNSKLVMYLTVNTAFVNYLDQFPNITETLEFPIIKNKTTFEQTLPISLNIP